VLNSSCSRKQSATLILETHVSLFFRDNPSRRLSHPSFLGKTILKQIGLKNWIEGALESNAPLQFLNEKTKKNRNRGSIPFLKWKIHTHLICTDRFDLVRLFVKICFETWKTTFVASTTLEATKVHARTWKFSCSNLKIFMPELENSIFFVFLCIYNEVIRK